MAKIKIIGTKNMLKLNHLFKVTRKKAVTNVVVLVIIFRYCRHAECFNCNSIGHTAMDCTRKESKRKVRFQSGSKANVSNVIIAGRQLKVAGRLTETLDVYDCDVEFVCDTDAELSILTEGTSDMLSLELRKPDCQLTSADGSGLNAVGKCNVHISKHSHSINAGVYVIGELKKSLLGTSELRQFAMNNDNVLNCNATVNVGAASMYTNVFSAFSAGTGGKESDAVVTTSDFTVTSSNGTVDRNSSCALSTSASTACSEKLPIVQSICSVNVEAAVSMEMGANFSTQSMEVITFEMGRVF